jgi:CRP/FNR family transcriptional regulator
MPLLEHEAGIAAALCRMLAERVRYLVSLVENLSLKSVETRVAEYLLTADDGGEVPRNEWLSHAELAARLGTVPDVLGRVLKNLERAGLIRATRGTIRILDPRGLNEKIDGESD